MLTDREDSGINCKHLNQYRNIIISISILLLGMVVVGVAVVVVEVVVVVVVVVVLAENNHEQFQSSAAGNHPFILLSVRKLNSYYLLTNEATSQLYLLRSWLIH